MSPTRTASSHRWLYISALIVLVALAFIGLLAYTQQKATNEARAKAQLLNDALVAEGLRPLNVDNTALVLGTDGGAVCKDPNSALKRALWRVQTANGAGGPGLRPIIADHRILKAGAEVIKVYCPDNLAEYQARIDELKSGDLVR